MIENKGKAVIVGLLVVSTLADYITYILNPQFWAFDMSPLVVFSKSLWLITLVKFSVVIGLVWLIYKCQAADIWKFMWVLVAQYLIVAQLFGAVSNLQVAEQNPPPEAAPTPQEAVSAGVSFAWLYAYYPIAFAMVGFALWRWCFYNREKEKLEDQVSELVLRVL